MTAAHTESWHRVRVWLARTHQMIGWSGVAGCALVMISMGVAAAAWSAHGAFERTRSVQPVVTEAKPSQPAAIVASSLGPSDLPQASEVPLLLTQIEHAALGNGLEWRTAEYRIMAATLEQPASLEVRCSIKGQYPKLRGMLVQLLSSVPAFAIRGFDATRPNADAPDVEAKLVLAVFLQDGAPAVVVPIKGAP